MAITQAQRAALLRGSLGALRGVAAQRPQLVNLGGGYVTRVQPTIGQTITGALGGFAEGVVEDQLDRERRARRLQDLESELTVRGIARRQEAEALAPTRRREAEAASARRLQDRLRADMLGGGFRSLPEMAVARQRERELGLAGAQSLIESRRTAREAEARRASVAEQREQRLGEQAELAEATTAFDTVVAQERRQREQQEARRKELRDVTGMIDEMQRTLRRPAPLDYAKFLRAHPNVDITSKEYEGARLRGMTDEQIAQELGNGAVGAPRPTGASQTLDDFFR